VVNIDSTTLKIFGGIAGNVTPLVASAAPEFAYVSFTETGKVAVDSRSVVARICDSSHKFKYRIVQRHCNITATCILLIVILVVLLTIAKKRIGRDVVRS
jgi:hypothetical protein